MTYSYVTNIMKENYLGYLLINSYEQKNLLFFHLRLAWKKSYLRLAFSLHWVATFTGAANRNNLKTIKLII